MIALLQQSPVTFIILAVVLVFSLVLHELGHGYSALRAGDTTARDHGRLTFNPIKHLDPIGTLLLLLVGFGWAKPVPIDPSRFGHPRRDLFVVSIAGIVINLVLAAVFGLALRLLYGIDPVAVNALLYGGQALGLNGIIALLLVFAGSINLILALFNLLPIPPLDGSKILQSFLPERYHPFFWQLEQYSWVFFILIFFVLREPIGRFLGQAQQAFFGFFLG